METDLQAFLRGLRERAATGSIVTDLLVLADFLEEGRGDDPAKDPLRVDFIRANHALTEMRPPDSSESAKTMMALEKEIKNKGIELFGDCFCNNNDNYNLVTILVPERWSAQKDNLWEAALLSGKNCVVRICSEYIAGNSEGMVVDMISKIEYFKSFGVVKFDLSRHDLPARGVTTLANSPHLTNLTLLNLRENRMDDIGAAALANSPYLTKLTELNIWYNRIGSIGITALANSPHLTNLTKLTLVDDGIGVAGIAALAEWMIRRERTGNPIKIVTGYPFEQAIDKEKARQVELWTNNLGPRGTGPAVT